MIYGENKCTSTCWVSKAGPLVNHIQDMTKYNRTQQHKKGMSTGEHFDLSTQIVWRGV